MKAVSSHGRTSSTTPAQSFCTPSILSRDSASIFDETGSAVLEPPKALTSKSPFPSAQSSPQRPSSISSSNSQRGNFHANLPGHQLSHLVPQHGESALGYQQKSGLQIPPFTIPKTTSFILESPQSSVPSSPSKEKWSFVSNFGDIKPSETKLSPKGGILADWFKGESDPISIGLIPSSTKEKTDPLEDMVPQMVALPFGLGQSKPTVKPADKPSAPNVSRFSFFSAKASASSATKPKNDDELAQLDIKTALLPNGQVDPFSPSSFKNLLQNAEGLLSRLQNAYKQRTTSLQEVIAENEAQSEELIEAQTKAKHLKLQLDDLSAKLAEQDEAVMSMVNELATVKQARREDEASRKKTIRIVDVTAKVPQVSCRREKHRTSLASTVSDSGFESDDDSLFSKEHGSSSPTITSTPTSSMHSPALSCTPFETSQPAAKLAQTVPTETEAQPAHDPKSAVASERKANEDTSCTTSKVVHSSEAWDVVDILKQENKGLKERVGHLEGALDGCLELVQGLSF